MVVRVRVRIARNGKEVVASALANSGYDLKPHRCYYL